MFRIITGIIVTLFGLWLVWMGVGIDVGTIVTGLIFVGIGAAILLNKREDKIEEINNNEHKSEKHE